MNNIENPNSTNGPEYQQNPNENIGLPNQDTSKKKKSHKKLIIIAVFISMIIITSIILFFIYYKNKKLSISGVTKDISAGMQYVEPCSSGDKEGCIMEKAYSKIKKSSTSSNNYTMLWNEAFKECEKYPNDDEAGYSINQCKVDVCENLSLGDGNIKYNYPEESDCKKEVMKVCPDGSIIDNIPCACDVPAGPYAAYDEDWLENYWNKYRKNDTPLYCCSGKQQEMPCK